MSQFKNAYLATRNFFSNDEVKKITEIGYALTGNLLPFTKTAWVFNVAKWKRPLLRKYFPFYRMRFMALKESVYEHRRAIMLSADPVFIVWGMKQPDDLEAYAAEFDVPIVRVEDGFFRSIGLGAQHTLPYSLCIDKSGIYFDSSRTSDLEIILSTHDFTHDRKLMETARRCIDEIRLHGLSKYNQVIAPKAHLLYGPKVKPRVLVIGQVEDDQSLLYGCSRIMTNVELIQLAASENPDAQIIYKTHPDILAGKRMEISDPKDVAHLAEIIPTSLTIKDALHEVDRVYTLTSLAGFEALLHGVPVTTVGAPFYSGWGLTDDRQIVNRRTRKLSLEEVFAGAYLLYPRYYDPDLRSHVELPDVIETFKEQLAQTRLLTPENELEILNPFNLATRSAVNARFIYNSTVKSVAIVTDNLGALKLAKGLAAKGKKVTILATRDAMANANDMLLTYEESQSITISSLHKRYSVAMSEIERQSVDLAKTFSFDLAHVLRTLAGKFLSEGVIEAITLGLEDHVYFEAVRFHGMRACLDEFDATVIYIDNHLGNIDVIKSAAYHGGINGQLGKVYLKTTDGTTRQIVHGLFEPEKLDFDGLLEEATLISKFASLWHDLQDERYDDYACLKQYVAICGNVAKENYAYLPASMKLVETFARKSNKQLLFYSSGLLNAEGQEEVKALTLIEQLSPRSTVYNGCAARYVQKYPATLMSEADIFKSGVNAWFMQTARKRLPQKFLDIFQPKVEKFIQGLFPQIIFIAESMRTMSRCSLFATAMDRSMTSRILSAIADSRGIPTIGIQPQIISSSPRYTKPAVQKMGVIDDSQVDVYESLGASRDSMTTIGSVNITSRLLRIEECEAAFGKPPSLRRVLFAMQHSTTFEMISTALALRDIADRLGLEIVVKPHPHQEVPVLHEIRRIFSKHENVSVLSRESDTYEAAASCGIVVGLYSSVLLESALSGKPVVVSAFKDIHPSIDFSVRGLALKALDPEQLEAHLTDIMSNGPAFAAVKQSSAQYLNRNPQFKRPYSDAAIEQFIESSMR